jgi:hypothetical protein
MKLLTILMGVFTLNFSVTGFGSFSFTSEGKKIKEVFPKIENGSNDPISNYWMQPDFLFKLGPETDLKWNYSTVSLAMDMDLSLASLSEKSSQDLFISRIWQGLYIYIRQVVSLIRVF